MTVTGGNGRLGISVLIPVRNEEKNLGACLKSVEFADEVVVVDSGSTDATARIGRCSGATVLQFNYVAGGPRKKNWALQNYPFRNEWILIIDADERVTPELERSLSVVCKGTPRESGFYINRRLFFLGRWIRHAGYYPSWNLRLLRRGQGLYEQVPIDTNSGDNEVHEHMIVNGEIGRLCGDLEHYAYPSLSSFIEKHDRYSNWEALGGEAVVDRLQVRGESDEIASSISLRRRMKALARRTPCSHWFRFVYHYILRGGILDGYAGYVLCHLLAEYEMWIAIKRYESRLPAQP